MPPRPAPSRPTTPAAIRLTLDPPQRAPVRERFREGAIEVRSRNRLPARERLLLEVLPTRFERALTICDTRAVLALALRALGPEAAHAPRSLQLDAQLAARARRAVATHRRRVPVECVADLPPPPAPATENGHDLIVLSAPLEWPLAIEWIEQAHDALRLGGLLLVGAERSPHEVRTRVKKIFGAADPLRTVRRPAPACVVAARRRRAEPRARARVRTLVRELRGRQIELFARPGVAGGRALAPGVRELSELMHVPLGGSLCELACGNGALGLTAARLGAANVWCVDPRARAIDLVQRAATHAGLDNVHTALVPVYDAARVPARPHDVVLAALPPETDLGRAGDVVRAAHALLREGGRVQLTGARTDELETLLRTTFGNVQRHEVEGRFVLEARRLAQLDG